MKSRLVLSLGILLVFGFLACDTGTGGNTGNNNGNGGGDPPKTVAAEYRFSYDGFTLGETTAVAVNAVNFGSYGGTPQTFSLTGVYTEDNGPYDWGDGTTTNWAYLYDSSGKIGVVTHGDGYRIAVFGKSNINIFTSQFQEVMDRTDMSDTPSGAFKNYP